MPAGAEHFCGFLSRLISKYIAHSLSFYNVFVSFWLLCAAITEIEALIQNDLLKEKRLITSIGA